MGPEVSGRNGLSFEQGDSESPSGQRGGPSRPEQEPEDEIEAEA